VARLPTLCRAAPGQLPPLRVGARDVAIVRAVWRYRALTTHQLEALFFGQGRGGKINTRCQRRLQLLFQHGYLWRDEQPVKLSEGRRPLLYRLDRRGAELLAAGGEDVDWVPADNDAGALFLEHLLATNDFRVAVTIAARAVGVGVDRWLDDETLRRRESRQYVQLQGRDGAQSRVAIVPDGYFRLQLAGHALHFFLELDRGTVVGRASRWGRRDWRRKVLAYAGYIASGQFEQRYNARGVRILTVVPSAGRLAHLKEITEAAGGRRRFWFAVASEVRPETVLAEPIWHIASQAGVHPLLEEARATGHEQG